MTNFLPIIAVISIAAVIFFIMAYSYPTWIPILVVLALILALGIVILLIIPFLEKFLLRLKSLLPSHSNSISKFIQVRETVAELIPPCELSQYRTIISALPRPSDHQIENFIEFVCSAHSWYKHLPLDPPGMPFRFFIDPYAGYDRILRDDGRVMHEERTENSKRFHYTWMTTDEYRKRFGYLAYDSGASTKFFLHSVGNIRECVDRPLFATSDREYQIPPEVATAGSISLTALIHPYTATVSFWKTILNMEGNYTNNKLEAIKTLCKQIIQQNERRETEMEEKLIGLSEPKRELFKRETYEIISKSEYEPNDDLLQLLSEKKQPLLQEMENAIRRMLQVVYE